MTAPKRALTKPMALQMPKKTPGDGVCRARMACVEETANQQIENQRIHTKVLILNTLPALTTLRFPAGRAAFCMLAFRRATAALTRHGLAARGPFESEQSGRGPRRLTRP